jgi:hypothetical protein
VNHPKWPNKKGKLSAPPRPDGQAIFFVKRLLVEFRMPAAIEEAKAALGRGEQVVFKILGVNDTHLTGEGGNLGAALDAIPTVTRQKGKDGTIEKWVPIPGAKERVEALRASGPRHGEEREDRVAPCADPPRVWRRERGGDRRLDHG